ncbi:MAG TPA: hypothetical protein VH761_03050 [Ilumatobacteraceae bacterium]
MKHASTPTFEIIELIDDDEPSDHGFNHSSPLPHESGSRWIGIAVTTALFGAIAYGVISSAISSNAAKKQPPPTTAVAPTSTSTPPVSAVKLVSPQFYVADQVPDGFTMHFAETLGMGGNTADFVASGTAELWATSGANATTGSWFVVSRNTHHATGRNAYRTVADGVVVLVEHDEVSGATRLSFTKNGDRLEITAYGWADRQLLRLAHSVYVADDEIRYDSRFFTTDHKKMLDADPASAIYGLPVAWVGYTTAVPAGLAQNFSITVSSDPGVDRDIAARFALTHLGQIGSSGFTATIGQLASDPSTTVIQWHDGDRLITVRGNIDVGLLQTIALGVHPGDNTLVREQVDPDPPKVVSTEGEPRPVSSGWLDGPWFAEVAPGTDGFDWFVWWIGQPSATGSPSQSRIISNGVLPRIETVVNHGKTYVLARAPRSMDDAVLHINRNGLPSVTIGFVDVGSDVPDRFAAFAFSEAVPFSAQIVSGGGTAAMWPRL